MNAHHPSVRLYAMNRATAHRWGQWGVGLLVLALAAGLRLWQLDQLPPGLFFDEAFNGVNARAVSMGQAFPLYFPENNGREPLFIYLAALFVHRFGPTPYALRLCAAVIGILTVPVIYHAAQMLLRTENNQKSSTTNTPNSICWPALVAAAVIAFSFWHLSLSRLAFRVILLPPLSALAVAYFWRGWQGQRSQYYGWAGFWLGATLYTYTAARLLPIVIVLFVGYLACADLVRERFQLRRWWQQWQVRRQGLLLLITVAMITCVPLFYAIYTDPTLLVARTGDISIFTVSAKEMPGTPLERLGTNLSKTASAFYWEGDRNPRHNLPGRPFLDWPMALLFTLGWWYALRHGATARMQLLLLWMAIMLVPTLFSTEAPHALRSAGLLPPMALLIAIGAETMMRRLQEIRFGQVFGILLLITIIGYSGLITARDYFTRWAALPALGVAFDIDLQLAATTVMERLPSIAQGESLILSRRLYLSPQMRFAVGKLPRRDLPGDLPDAEETAANLPELAFLIEEDIDPNQLAYLLYNDQDNKTSDGMARVVASWLQTATTDEQQPLLLQLAGYEYTDIAAPLHQPSWPRLRLGNLPPSVPLSVVSPIRYPLNVTFANGMRLIGYDLTADPIGVDRATPAFLLTTFWQRPAQSMPLDTDSFNLFSHLVFNESQIQRNGELGGSYPLSLWQTGQRFDDRRLFLLEDPTVAGKVYFETGLYQAQGDEIRRIDIVDGNGNIADNQVILGATWVGTEPSQVDLASFTPLHVHFAEQIELVGWQWSPPTQGQESLQVTLAWRALDRMTTDYTAFIHLLNDAQEILSQGDQPPGGNENPTTQWAPDEINITHAELPIVTNTDLSTTLLRVGFYEPVSGLQLPITRIADGDIAPENTTYLLLNLNDPSFD